MTTLAIILKAKKEIECAIEGKSNVISRAFDTQEYQASQMGKALALLEVAEDQLREDYTWKDRPQSKILPQNKSEQDITETSAAIKTNDQEVITNADHIRAMGDKELAEWLCSISTGECCERSCPARELCKPGSNGMREWVKEPYIDLSHE